ncbi:MAG: right-handed parallel beta-helix repeat-containing protein [Prevotella sp.]|nr:right-handed parallel beta-helix repeat-containing protein [Prevotella sp.]
MKIRTLLTSFLTWMATSLSAQNSYDILSFGAKGDGLTDDAVAIQKAIDRCSEAGGGVVLLPRNHVFLSGPVELKSNVELHLEATATLKANPDEGIYRLSAFGENRGEGMLWLWAKDAENISITGKGTIHGNGIAFMGAELADSYELKPLADQTFDPRPHVLTLTNVQNLTIRDVTIREGAYWTVHLIGCNEAVIDGINLLNNLKIRNGDGIDLDHSKNVRIANCHITSGDDCICLKNRREFEHYGSCHDIVVTNCVMSSRSCAIKIGSENMDSIYNVVFDNCIITGSNRGLGIQNRDEGTVTDVVFSNIQLDCRLWSDVWWGKAEPIYVTSYPRANGNHKDANWRFPKGQIEGRCGEVSRIYFNNITALSENGCFVGGDVPGKVKDIYFNNVRVKLNPPDSRLLTPDSFIMDKRPCKGEGFIQVSADELMKAKVPVITEHAEIIFD